MCDWGREGFGAGRAGRGGGRVDRHGYAWHQEDCVGGRSNVGHEIPINGADPGGRGNTHGGQDPRPRMGDPLVQNDVAPMTDPMQGNPTNPPVVIDPRPELGKEVVMSDEIWERNWDLSLLADLRMGIKGMGSLLVRWWIRLLSM
jgi:hypothetical protein